MSISYHGVVGFGSGKTTLPSVESWGNNMNILRDPPKSITTRKIDKVGETSDITQMIDNAGDRICEAIQVYARGVNPMVAVSFDNYGNNGGQKAGNVSSSGMNINGGGSKQAYLPYRIMDGGAFRPPIRDQRDLLPLSRLPRTATSSFTKPGFSDFSKKAMIPSDDGGKEFRTIKKDVIKSEIRPTAVYQIETPIKENYEVKYVIKDPLHYEKQVNKKGDRNERVEFENVNSKNYIQNPLQIDMNVNSSRNVSKIPINESYNLNTENYIQNPLQIDMNVNSSQNISKLPTNEIYNVNTNNYTHDPIHMSAETGVQRNVSILPVDEMYNIDTHKKIKDSIVIDYETPHKSFEKYEYIHNDIQLERTLPQYQTQTNSTRNIHKNINSNTTERHYTTNRPNTSAQTNYGSRQFQTIDNISSRNYNLKQTINAGGFNPTPSAIPQVYKDNSIQELDSQRTQMRKNIYDMQHQRNTTIGNISY